MIQLNKFVLLWQEVVSLLKYKTESLKKRNKKLSENARFCAIHSNFNSDFSGIAFLHPAPTETHFKYLRQKVQPPRGLEGP